MNAGKRFLLGYLLSGTVFFDCSCGQMVLPIETQAMPTVGEQTFDVLFEEEIGINGELTIYNRAQRDQNGRPLAYKMTLGGTSPIKLSRQWYGTLVMLPDGTFSKEKSRINNDKAKLNIDMGMLDDNNSITRFWVEYLFGNNCRCKGEVEGKSQSERKPHARLLTFLTFEPNSLVQALAKFQDLTRKASTSQVGAKMKDWQKYLPFSMTTDNYTFNLQAFPESTTTWFDFEPNTKKEPIRTSVLGDEQECYVEVLKGPSTSRFISPLPWKGRKGAIVLSPFTAASENNLFNKYLEFPEFSVSDFKVLYDPKGKVLRAIECELKFEQPFNDFVIPNDQCSPNPPFGIVTGKNCSFAVRCYINPMKRSKYGRK